MAIKRGQVILTRDVVLNTYKSKKHGIEALMQYSNWFPVRATPKLAGIVADLMGDGHLQDSPKLRLDYSSKSTEELERFNGEVLYLFGIKGKIRDCKTNRYGTKNLGVNNKPLGRVLKSIGVPAGSKVLTRCSIPNWVLNDKDLFSRFINRLFSCEGCVDLKYKCIEIKMYKTLSLIEDGIKFFIEIKEHLDKYFEIKTTNPFLEGRTNVRKDGKKTKGIRLKIKRKESLKRFQIYVGFEDKNKKRRLAKIIESFP